MCIAVKLVEEVVLENQRAELKHMATRSGRSLGPTQLDHLSTFTDQRENTSVVEAQYLVDGFWCIRIREFCLLQIPIEVFC